MPSSHILFRNIGLGIVKRNWTKTIYDNNFYLTLSLPRSPIGNFDTLPQPAKSPFVYRYFAVLKIFLVSIAQIRDSSKMILKKKE